MRAYAWFMDIQYPGFGSIVVAGNRIDHDIVIDGGSVRERDKTPSRAHKRGGHTPLSADEEIPWSGKNLVVGTGYSGRLPVLPEVELEAVRHGVELVLLPTAEACALLRQTPDVDVYAILHLTC